MLRYLNVIEVRRGHGDGTFSATVSYSAPTGFALTTEDVNGDGLLDLATVGRAGPGSILLGNIDGSFSSPLTFHVQGLAFSWISTGDFNGDSVSDLVATEDGNGAGNTVSIVLSDTRLTASTPLLDLLSQSSAREALTTTRATQDRISSELGAIGAMQSRLSSAAKNLAIQKENVTAAYSRITNVDVADETSRLVAGRVRQQAGAAVLAQANQSPALALRLLSG